MVSRVKVFISYSTEDKYFAGKIKDCFEKYVGFEVFLAHNDLNPSDDWQLEIWNNLQNCHFFIPLISKSSIVSCFANQEIGIAITSNKRIIPISVDGTNPCGFIANLQAYRTGNWTDDTFLKAVSDIFSLCIKKESYKEFLLTAMDSIVYAFSQSNSFKITKTILKIMLKTDITVKFTDEQLSLVIKAAKENPKIHESKILFPKLIKFLQDNYNITKI